MISVWSFGALLFAYLLMVFVWLHCYKRNAKLLFRNWMLEGLLSQTLKYLNKDSALKCDKDNEEKELIENIKEVLEDEHS